MIDAGSPSSSTATVRTGAERLLTDAAETIRGLRIGVLTNHTGRLHDGRSTIDAIVESGLATVVALFGPEHGIAGDAPDGNPVDHSEHPRYHIPIHSLYGHTHKPTPDMLHGIDVLVCDIQDIGSRFYTYLSTIALAIEAAAEQGVRIAILDRPNPIRGLTCSGPVREPSLKSFVGWLPIPVTYGMTIGELARMCNEEGWLAKGAKADLTIVQLEGWSREQWFDETGVHWVPPSPNIPRLSSAIVYPGMCFVEGTSLSEGRGTVTPFEVVGAPWVDSRKVVSEVKASSFPGVEFLEESFTPRAIDGMAKDPKYEGERCHGVRTHITQRDGVDAVRLGITVLAAFKRVHPRETELRHRRFDILTGDQRVRHLLERGASPDDIVASWMGGLEHFEQLRRNYLLYP